MSRPPAAPDDDKNVDALKSADAIDLHRAVREEGEAELERPAGALLWSGLAAGIAINASLVAEGALHAHLPDARWRTAVVALGYPLGFLIVILGRMQLFTESTITAMLPLATRPSWWALRRTLRLWGLVLAANLSGAAIAAGLVALGLLGGEPLRTGMIAVSMPIVALGPVATFFNAIPAGFMIAIIAWTLPNAREQSFLVIFAITYVVAIGGFSHSIVGSVEAFLLLFTGHATAAQAVGSLILPAIVGNLLGGAGIFALLAHAQVRSDGGNSEG